MVMVSRGGLPWNPPNFPSSDYCPPFFFSFSSFSWICIYCFNFSLLCISAGLGSAEQGSSSFTLGDTLCAALVPFVAIVESLVFLFCDCFNQHSSRSGGRRQQTYDLEKLARDSRCFTVNEVEALYELYRKLSNSIIKDGLIHKEELQLALLRTVTDENLFLNRIFDVFDEKKNGVIEFEEFIHALSIFHPHTPLAEKIEFTFRLYDLRQTGFIEREEVKQMLLAILGESNVALPENLIEAILDTTFEEADTDRDARINREEWREYVMRHPSLLKNMTLPYLKDITTAFPSFIFNTEVDD